MAQGERGDARGTIADGAAPFYATYETADRRYISVGAMEPEFYAELVDVLGFSLEDLPAQSDRSTWTAVKKRFIAPPPWSSKGIAFRSARLPIKRGRQHEIRRASVLSRLPRWFMHDRPGRSSTADLTITCMPE